VVIDPIALMPIFLSLTQGMDGAHRRGIALRMGAVSFGILAMFAFFGEPVLDFIGISMPAFRIAGGVLLFLTALDMLFERRTKRREDRIEDMPDPSVFPLAIPLVAGPGAITTVILLAGQNPGVQGTMLVLGVAFAVLVVLVVSFFGASLIERAIGRTGINVVTRLLGMLLAALAVQFILVGLRDFGFAG
jgi:multiple antibiotic resistance protein